MESMALKGLKEYGVRQSVPIILRSTMYYISILLTKSFMIRFKGKGPMLRVTTLSPPINKFKYLGPLLFQSIFSDNSHILIVPCAKSINGFQIHSFDCRL